MRRSWLAQATSSRRASKSCSMLSAIALNEVASCCDLGGAAVGARAPRSPAASRCASSPTRRIERGDRAREHERRDHGGARRTGGDGEDLHVGAHVEHDPAGEQHRGERHADGRRVRGRRAGARPSARRAARARRASPTARLAAATARARPITGRSGSRRPRRSCRCAGRAGSVSIFSRSRRMWTVTVPVSTAAAWPQTRSISWSREKT